MHRSRPSTVERRTVLKTAGVAAAGALAGCAGSSGGGGSASGASDAGGSSSGDGDSDSGGTAAATGTPATTGTGSSGGDASVDAVSFDGWFDGVANFAGRVADRTGQSEVEVTVGAQGNGGNFAFAPPAARVSPGTTVVWRWTGAGGSHDVVAESGAFESELVAEEGHTFSDTFEEAGQTRYACTPHETVGMKGAVVVG